MSKRTHVRVECRDCGIVLVELGEVTLRLCVDNGQWSYCFRCLECGLVTPHVSEQESVRGAIGALVAVGVPVQRWRMPAELVERRTTATAPLLTPDDALDFHMRLEREDWFDELL